MKLEETITRLRDVARRKHFALSTEEAYVAWTRRFARFIDARLTGAEEPARKMEAFLTQLARQGCAASTQNQAFNALLFLYRDCLGREIGKVDALRANKPMHLRHAPERHEVVALLAALRDTGGQPTRLIVHLIYGCGLRVSEPLNLRIKDVLLEESRLIIRAAKGGKDRMVPLPCSLAPELKAQIALARAVAARDAAARLPVKLPGLLAQKYPHWQFSPKWGWLFPALQPCPDPRSGVTVRWRCHEANVQRCVRAAARPLGLDITPHHLRHAYATHCLNAGQNPRAIQEAMGHQSIETTMGYLHAEALAVRSPLEFV